VLQPNTSVKEKIFSIQQETETLKKGVLSMTSSSKYSVVKTFRLATTLNLVKVVLNCKIFTPVEITVLDLVMKRKLV
jgi:hypothetical protein